MPYHRGREGGEGDGLGLGSGLCQGSDAWHGRIWLTEGWPGPGSLPFWRRGPSWGCSDPPVQCLTAPQPAWQTPVECRKMALCRRLKRTTPNQIKCSLQHITYCTTSLITQLCLQASQLSLTTYMTALPQHHIGIQSVATAPTRAAVLDMLFEQLRAIATHVIALQLLCNARQRTFCFLLSGSSDSWLSVGEWSLLVLTPAR